MSRYEVGDLYVVVSESDYRGKRLLGGDVFTTDNEAQIQLSLARRSCKENGWGEHRFLVMTLLDYMEALREQAYADGKARNKATMGV